MLSSLLMGVVRPRFVQLGHPWNCAKPRAGLTLQLFSIVRVVGKRDGEWSRVVLLSPFHFDAADAEDSDEGAEEDETGHGENRHLNRSEALSLLRLCQRDFSNTKAGQWQGRKSCQ